MKGFEEWTLADVERINAARKGSALKVSAEYPNQAAVDATERSGAKHPSTTPKKSKYRNEKTLADGFVFDSRREAEYWLVLKLREKAGEITELRRQVDFPLYCHDLVNPALAHHIADIRLDMVFRDSTGQLRYLDPKGFRTRLYLLKRQWFEKQYRATIEEV